MGRFGIPILETPVTGWMVAPLRQVWLGSWLLWKQPEAPCEEGGGGGGSKVGGARKCWRYF